jgi:thymidylate synthase (FAD)
MGRMRVRLLYHTDVEALKRVVSRKGVVFGPEVVLDHVVYMFEIEDRVASYDQESQRFSAATKEGVVVPPSIASKSEAAAVFEDALKGIYSSYDKLVAEGVPKEDARYILPNGIKTKIVMTINARSLMHVVWQRTALQAQWEIRELANHLFDLAREATPELWSKIIER